MAFSLSDRINGRIKNDPGSGFRANPADFSMSAASSDRGSFGAEQNPSMSNGQPQMSSGVKGNPHSAAGFRRALERTERTQGKLSSDIASKRDFSGSGFKKPNYFGQGGRRHGMHIGAGSPATIPATDAGSGFGGTD